MLPITLGSNAKGIHSTAALLTAIGQTRKSVLGDELIPGVTYGLTNSGYGIGIDTGNVLPLGDESIRDVIRTGLYRSSRIGSCILTDGHSVLCVTHRVLVSRVRKTGRELIQSLKSVSGETQPRSSGGILGGCQALLLSELIPRSTGESLLDAPCSLRS